MSEHRFIRFTWVTFIYLIFSSAFCFAETSLRFQGNGSSAPGLDRVKIKIDKPAKPADIGKTDFTLEFWMRATPGENNNVGNCLTGNDNWITGNIIIDRDVFGAGDKGDFGISLFNDGLAFGIGKGSNGAGICSSTNVQDNNWHHVAVTRNFSSGLIRIFVDGILEGQGTGPSGNITYRNKRSTSYPNSDPFLVIGAEKHDAGPQYPSFTGWLDEVRLSKVIRYTSNFSRPLMPFRKKPKTVALYHFNEGSGNSIKDSSKDPDGPSNGVRKYGGTPPGPDWSNDNPFWPNLALTQVIAGLDSPVHAMHSGDGTGRLFIAEQGGLIKILQSGVILPTPFLDISGLISCCGEQGLLGLAFPSDFASKQYFYVNYTNTNGNTVIARYDVSGDPDVADPNSGVILLTINQPDSNHNGGNIVFGPDGYLYIGMGDGGSGGDPENRAQNKNSLLGKMLRIDVESGPGASLPYKIPADNPYVNKSGRDEIWAIGLRNPWRFSFDRSNENLFTADVGQGDREEINFQKSSFDGGANYGWRILEGKLCFNPSTNCKKPKNYVPPVSQYTHDAGCSVTGGFVYRGTTFPRMFGTYFFGDFCSGAIWGLKKNGKKWYKRLLSNSGLNISSFGEDEAGELYIIDYSGTLYQVTDTFSTD